MLSAKMVCKRKNNVCFVVKDRRSVIKATSQRGHTSSGTWIHISGVFFAAGAWSFQTSERSFVC